MHRHTIDPFSTALGLLAATAGIIVAVGRADSLADNAVAWIALAAIVLGIGLIPWTRRARLAPAQPEPTSIDRTETEDEPPAGN